MKKLILYLSLLIPCTGFAQSYSIDWFTIDGGGGTSSNGQYAVSGTIGQPDAGRLTGGNYTLDGGFWGIIAAVQTPGAPLLTITLNSQPPAIIVSWPSPSLGFSLQQNTNLHTTNWTSFGGIVGDNGTTRSVTNSPPIGNKYLRLFHP